MTQRPGDLIERTRKLYEVVMGQSPELTADFSLAFAALLEGLPDIVVELPWNETRPNEQLERHQIVLHSLGQNQERVLFYVPNASPDLVPGTEIGGQPGQGPARRVEADGLQSMALTDLARFFAEGRAHALIPPREMFT